MKQIILFVLIAACVHTIHAQNQIETTGDIGIGTTTPSSALHIKRNQSGWLQQIAGTTPDEGYFVGMKILSGYAGETNKWVGISAIAESQHSNKTGLGLYTNKVERFRIGHNGNIGIGTKTPNAQLHLNKYQTAVNYPTQTSRGDIFQLYTNVNNSFEIGLAGKSNTRRSWILSRHSDISGQYGQYYNTLHLQPDIGDKSQYRGIAIGYKADKHIDVGTHLAVNGNVGIGTTKPDAQLHLNKYQTAASYPTKTSRGDIYQLYTNVNNSFEIGLAGKSNTRRSWILSRHSSLSEAFGKYYNTLHLQPDIGDKSQYRGIAIGYKADKHIDVGTHLAVNGKVGIGTTKPDMKLTVNGNIHAKEVKIDLDIPAPDYVFASDYKLRSIKEVETYIKQNSHLPEIPSAEEFAKNGVMQAEMDMQLLKKIEELTLYTIQQQKEIETLKMLVHQLVQSKE